MGESGNDLDIFDEMAQLLDLESVFVSDLREQFRLAADRSEVWTLFTCRSGSIGFEIDAETRALSAREEIGGRARAGEAARGDVVICPPGALFRRRMLRPTAFLWARFDARVALPVGRTTVGDLARLSADIDRIAAQSDAAARGHVDLPPATVAAHLVSDIVLLSLESDNPAARGMDELARAAARILMTEYARPDLVLGEVATRLSISPSMLSRRFAAAYGKSPIAFLREVRLGHARRLLLETTETLAVVARASGYTDPFYFTRVWTRAWGVSPARYRHLHRV